MIVSYKAAKVTKPAPGITRRILAHSAKIMLTEHTLEKGAILPEHKHPHEQLVYLLSGEIVVEMSGGLSKVVAGDSFVIPSNVSHKVTALTNAIALDTFTPAREDYL
jgi:quercetin dioxygenase-like cupin family protein